MSTRSYGRGVVAAIGLLVLVAGLAGGVMLWILAAGEPDRTADGFARAAPGCTTTLAFSEPGSYYVYEERIGQATLVDGCAPSVEAGQPFIFEMRDDTGAEVEQVNDTSVSYDLDAGVGVSVARITIDAPGDYEVSVRGGDPAVVAAIGRDPDDGVAQLRQGAIGAAAVGVVLGGLLLWWASRRRADRQATHAAPDGPTSAGQDVPPWAAPTPPQPPAEPTPPGERTLAELAGEPEPLPAPPPPERRIDEPNDGTDRRGGAG